MTGRLEVGFIARAHGLRGQVVVELVSNVTARVDPGSVLTTTADRRLEIVASSPIPGGASRHRWIVSFAGVHSKEDADALRGAPLLADPLPAADTDTMWVHQLIGASVVDVDGVERGVVTSVEANPASDLLVLDTGALVPLRFVTQHSAEQVVVDPPAGLWDL